MVEDERWLRMEDVIGRKAKESVWIPIWGSVEMNNPDRCIPRRYEECWLYNSLLVPLENRKEAMRLTLSDLQPMTDLYAVIGTDPYFPAYAFRNGYDTILGTNLVTKRSYDDGGDYEVNIHQDLLLDLRLKREGDKWVRPCEAWREVIRLSRSNEGRINLVEVKAEYLKDWLCVRKQGLVLVSHIERRHLALTRCEIIKTPERRRLNGGLLERWSYDCDKDGKGIIGDWTVETTGYEEIDAHEDVPVFDSSVDNRKMKSSKQIVKASEAVSKMSVACFTRTEWLPPGKQQKRMPFDYEGELSFICESDGRLKKSKALLSTSRYLWFENAVLKKIASMRGGRVRWITQETGIVGFGGGIGTHFGVNRVGLVNVFAKDIAEEVWWKQEIWKAHNVTPDGGVCSELTDAQQCCRPAKTEAPENLLRKAFGQVSLNYSAFTNGESLFLPFDSMNEVGNSIQRFNVQSHEDVLWLAKQITRLVIETINQDSLRKHAKIEKGEKLGSLKLLERMLSGAVGAERAYDLMSPLHAIYTLRIADAHVPKQDLDNAFEMLGIIPEGQLIRQGGRMIFEAAKTLHEIAVALFEATSQKRKTPLPQ